MSKTVFVIGSGPMIGSHVARLFAIKSFSNVALFSRSESNLLRDCTFVTSASASSTALTRGYSVDVTDGAALKIALERAIAELGVPEVVVFNPARIGYSMFGHYSAEDILEDFKVPNVGLYNTATVMLPYLQTLAKSDPKAHPSFFVTSGAIIHQPFAPVFSLSIAKAAQADLVKLLAEDNKNVVHVALITIGGQVTPEEPINNPTNIATKFWYLYEQKRGQWTFEEKCGW